MTISSRNVVHERIPGLDGWRAAGIPTVFARHPRVLSDVPVSRLRAQRAILRPAGANL
ncbi:MAG TPA: hypothetical protein VHY84_23600 [Bryobacteraceae bacterium]|nr:hypothetical protein [Bryobacteraceae bacterium]